MVIDVHCHFNSLSETQKKQVLQAKDNDAVYLDVSIDDTSFLASLALSARFPFLYTAAGFHPFSLDSFHTRTIEEYRKRIANNPKVIAVGEIGIDCKSHTELAKQQKVFESFIILAEELCLPVIVHNRWKDDTILKILDEHFSDYSNIIFHCFSQDIPFLESVAAKGGYVSFALNVLRKRVNLDPLIRAVCLSRLLLETDSPYMRIHERESTPLDIKLVYEYVAKVRGISLAHLGSVVAQNAQRILKLKGILF